MVNFRIIDENPLTYNEFKTCWLDVETYPTLKSICNHLGIGWKKCRTWGNEVTLETGFSRRSIEPVEHDKIYEDFKKDYLACELSQTELRKKYNLKSNYSYDKIRRRVTKETKLVRKGNVVNGLKKV